MKAEVYKLKIDKLVNVQTSMSNLNTKVDDLDVGKLKHAKDNTLKKKVNNLEKKNHDANGLIHINYYNTDTQNLEKKIEDVDNKIPYKSDLLTANVLNTKISGAENKIPDISSLVTTTVLNTKIGDVENKIPDHAKYINTEQLNKLAAEYLIII